MSYINNFLNGVNISGTESSYMHMDPIYKALAQGGSIAADFGTGNTNLTANYSPPSIFANASNTNMMANSVYPQMGTNYTAPQVNYSYPKPNKAMMLAGAGAVLANLAATIYNISATSKAQKEAQPQMQQNPVLGQQQQDPMMLIKQVLMMKILKMLDVEIPSVAAAKTVVATDAQPE